MFTTLKSLKDFISKHKTVNGFDKFCDSKPKGRVLLSYIVHPFLLPIKLWEKKLFSNRGMAVKMLTALNEMGYIVDIIDFENSTWKPKRDYDLFIGHGGKNFKHLIENKLLSKKNIYFSTGPYWKFLNIQEARRLYEFTLRTGHILPADRYIRYEEESANSLADGIICLGNKNILTSYSNFKNVLNINNGHFALPRLNLVSKNYEAGRRHFLFFSGRGNIHKGLDLLLEAFYNTDLHLHICQWIEPAFESFYFDFLYKKANIHFEGFVPMRSEKFYELIRKCNWVILPSCAEGQPGSVIECMAHGLIPILSEFANIDLEDFGIPIENLTIESVSKSISIASKMSAEECINSATKTSQISREKYSAEKFKDNFKDSVKKILLLKNHKNG